MKAKFYYRLGWDEALCKIIDYKKYDVDLIGYFSLCTDELRSIIDTDRELSGIEKVEKGELECYETGIQIFFTNVYKDRVEFSSVFEDEEWEDRTCTLEEYKRLVLAKKAFLMLPKEVGSYLEIKVNDL